MSENIQYVPTFKRINSYDYTVNKFKAYKTWLINNSNYNSTYNKLKIFQALKPTDEFRNGIIPLSSSKYTPIPNVEAPYTDKGIVWGSVEHLYYKDYNKAFNISKEQKLNLYTSASILNIPTLTQGEGIKRNTFSIIDYSSYSQINLSDDGKGNIIDESISTGSLIDKQYLSLYLGFNDVYDKKHKVIKDGSIYNKEINFSGTYTQLDGISTTGLFTGSAGKSFHLDTTNYIYSRHDEHFYDLKTKDDFSVSFWLKLPASQSIQTNQYNTVISKRREGYQMVQDVNTKIQKLEYLDLKQNIYPLNIGIYNSGSNNGKLFFERNDGSNYTLITSSATINNNTFNHVVINKTGSNIQLYINGTLNVTGSDKSNFNIGNKSDWYFGSEGINRNNLSGSLDELRFYNKGLSSSEVFSLYSNDFATGSAFQENRIGNIFYRTGQIILSDFRPRYNRVLLGVSGSQNYSGSLIGGRTDSGFSLQFKSTQTIYEHEIICKIKPSEFNLTLNPTIRVNDSLSSAKPKDFITGSYFNPYITTIGLYNNQYELVAVAKLSSPIPKLDDVPMNFIVKFDA